MTAVHSTGQKGGIYMAAGKNLVPGSAQMLLLRLLAERDMYGYQMIEELAQRSNDTFALKAGTLYPILHALEADGSIEDVYKRQTLTFFIISNINMSFLFVKAMTNGGPDGASEVFLSYMYKQAYTNSTYGYGMAVGVVVFTFSFALAAIVNKVTKREPLEF